MVERFTVQGYQVKKHLKYFWQRLPWPPVEDDIEHPVIREAVCKKENLCELRGSARHKTKI